MSERDTTAEGVVYLASRGTNHEGEYVYAVFSNRDAGMAWLEAQRAEAQEMEERINREEDPDEPKRQSVGEIKVRDSSAGFTAEFSYGVDYWEVAAVRILSRYEPDNAPQ